MVALGNMVDGLQVLFVICPWISSADFPNGLSFMLQDLFVVSA
uniref:Uncharacterized protein n=1 Tax=Aegilops tauschii subsp. strangulata TaxID=200361 RepID=A0A453R911_AEGTS